MLSPFPSFNGKITSIVPRNRERQMRSFLRLQRGYSRLPRDVTFFSATARFYTRGFASTPNPIKVAARRRWPAFVVGFTCGALASLTYIAYDESKPHQHLNPTDFTPFMLVGKDSVSSTSSIFTLQPTLTVQNARIYADAWRKGVWSVQVKQPQLQIARAYTPLPPINEDESISDSALRFLIRIEPQGEVSGYLHKLPLGATIELRGPHVEYQLPEPPIPDNIEEVLFIAGGTGIAPALQVAHTMLNYRRPLWGNPKMRILWANRRREDCLSGINNPPEVLEGVSRMEGRRGLDMAMEANPSYTKQPIPLASPQTALVEQLNTFKEKSFGNISVEYFVDEENNFITEDLLRARLHDASLASADRQEKNGYGLEKRLLEKRNTSGKKLIIVSGPDRFVKHYAGAKAWKDGREVQGILGGVLKDINPEGWDIQKL